MRRSTRRGSNENAQTEQTAQNENAPAGEIGEGVVSDVGEGETEGEKFSISKIEKTSRTSGNSVAAHNTGSQGLSDTGDNPESAEELRSDQSSATPAEWQTSSGRMIPQSAGDVNSSGENPGFASEAQYEEAASVSTALTALIDM